MDGTQNGSDSILCAALEPEFVSRLEESNSRYRFVPCAAKSVIALATRIEVDKPGIVLLPKSWLCDEGLGLLRELQDLDHEFVIAVVASDLNAATVAKCVPVGLAGVIDPEDSTDRIIRALDVICAGEVWIKRQRLVEAMTLLTGGGAGAGTRVWNALPSLTEREHVVLLKIMDGLSNRDIAKTLGISHETVKVHVKHVFSKLGVNRRTQLIADRLSGPQVGSLPPESLSL